MELQTLQEALKVEIQIHQVGGTVQCLVLMFLLLS